ncbi:MAG: YDG domain-containing protein [Verrucomicrobiota bacterium]
MKPNESSSALVLRFASLLVAASLLVSTPAARATAFTWTNTSGGNWSSAANWSPNGLPGGGDSAAITTTGNYTVAVNSAQSIGTLTLGASTGDGTVQTLNIQSGAFSLNNASGGTAQGALSISGGALTWNGGALSGVTTVGINGVLNIAAGGNTVRFSSLTLTNNGTVNWTNTTIWSGLGTTVYICNNGLWNEQSDDSFQGAVYGGATVFDNFGTFLKSGNAGTTTFDAGCTLNNSGTVNVQSGTLAMLGGGAGNGLFDIAGNAGILFGGGYNGGVFSANFGSLQLTGGALALNGAINGQSVTVSGGTLSLNGVLTSTNIQLTGGTLSGTNVLVGTLDWSGGALSGAMTVSNNSVLNIAAGGNTVRFSSLTLTNNGTVNWTNATIWSGLDTTVYICNNGLWNEQSDDYFEGAVYGGATVFDNFGTFLKSGNTGTTTFDAGCTLNNPGTVSVLRGTLLVQNGAGASGGGSSFDTAVGATLEFGAGYTFANGTAFAGGGNLLLPEGAAMNGVITAANLSLSGGTLIGTNVLAGTLNWSGGALSGAMTVSNNGVLNIAAAGNHVFFQALTLTNNGTVNWTNTTIWSGDGMTVYVYNNGLWNEQSDDSFQGAVYGGATVFDNFGTFLKSGNAGTTTLDGNCTLNNTGTVSVQSGTLSLSSYDLAGGTLNFGISGLARFGVVSLAGSPAPLTGALSANLNSNYFPLVNSSFQVLNFSSSSGAFTNINLPPVAVWQTIYNPANVTLQMLKLVPQLTWTNPASIVYGTLLSGAQLNAAAASPTNLSASLAGALTYSPPLGTTLFASNNQSLSVTFAPADSATYTNVTTNVSINVLKAPLTISSGLTANNKVYDRTTTATLSSNAVVLAGVVTGDTVTLNTNGYTANFVSANVGNSIAVTLTGLTLSGTSAANYTLTQPSLTANITPAPVTISSGITANSKVYNRTTTATLTSNNVVLLGVVTGDTLTLNTNGYAANFATAGVGSAIAVTVTGLTLSGTSVANYALTQPVGLTANITAAPVTISSGITANNKVYDRTTTATLSSNNVVLLGVVTGDTLTLNTNGYVANFTSAGAGTAIAVTVTGLTLTGASNADYALTQPAGLTANITAAQVSISSGITANNKVYNRTTTATLSSNNVVLLGVVSGDTLTLNTNGYTANFASAGVGAGIAVTVTGLTLSGTSAADYTLTQPSLTATITTAPVTISSGITANNKVYDRTTTASLSSNNVVLLGVVSGDTVTLNTNGYVANFATAGVGAGIAVTVTGLTLSGTSAADYTLTQPATLTANITAPSVQMVANLPNMVISWTTNATVFVLNQTASLTSPVAWSPVTSNITVSGTNNTVTLNASAGGDHFFELIAPP